MEIFSEEFKKEIESMMNAINEATNSIMSLGSSLVGTSRQHSSA